MTTAPPPMFTVSIGRIVFLAMRSPDGKWALGDHILPGVAAFLPMPNDRRPGEAPLRGSACLVVGSVAFGVRWRDDPSWPVRWALGHRRKGLGLLR